MKKTFQKFFLFSVVTIPEVAIAQTPDVSPELVNQLGSVIRWAGIFPAMIVLVVSAIGLKFVSKTTEKFGAQFAGRRLLFQKVATIIRFIVYIGSTAMVLGLCVRLDEKVLAVIGGTFAIAIGFAIRDLVASFIAGIIVMIDRPFQVGDRVSFGGEYGDITSIGLRSVRLQTLDDNTVTIPNNKFLTDITSNGNYGALDMQVVMDFYIGVDQDVALAQEIVTEAALTSRYVHLPKPVVVRVNQVIQDQYVAVRLRLKAYVLDTRHEKTFESDVNLRVIRTFRKHNIQPPAILHRSMGTSEFWTATNESNPEQHILR